MDVTVGGDFLGVGDKKFTGILNPHNHTPVICIKI
jgi:hypothetical protein